MELSGFYIKAQHNELGGGGEVLTCIELHDGKYIVMGYGQLCVYPSRQVWEDGAEDGEAALFAADIPPVVPPRPLEVKVF